MQINLTRFEAVVVEAKNTLTLTMQSSTAAQRINHQRWMNAINKASDEIQANPFIEYLENGTLIVLSSTSNVLYEIGAGACACPAGQFGHPCKHKAMKRLVERYLGIPVNVAPVAKPKPTPYPPGVLVKPQPKGEKYGCFDI